MLKEKITKWLGEEKWKATQTNYENHNQSLENLKSRIPELEEMILGEIENPITIAERIVIEYANISGREDTYRAYVRQASITVLENFINTLKGVK